MKIALLVSNLRAISLKSLRGPDIIPISLAEGLIKKGHKVVLFASSDSKFRGKLFSAGYQSFIKISKEFPKTKITDYEYALVSAAIQEVNQGDFDILHSHLSLHTAFFEEFIKKPLVATLHSPVESYDMSLYKNSKKQYYVAISKDQAKRYNSYIKNITGVVYNGIDIKQIKFSSKIKENNLGFVGRLDPEKGADIAIDVAKKLKLPIWIAGIYNPGHKFIDKYVKSCKKRKTGRTHLYIDVARKELYQNFYRKLKMVLLPIQWDEPFGLVFIEAMAAGTPVITFDRGAVSEIIKDGETGFIINSSPKDRRGDWLIKKTGRAGMIEAVQKIYSMPENEYIEMRINCRKHVEEKFTVEKMIDGYEKVYKKILKK